MNLQINYSACLLKQDYSKNKFPKFPNSKNNHLKTLKRIQLIIATKAERYLGINPTKKHKSFINKSYNVTEGHEEIRIIFMYWMTQFYKDVTSPKT